MQIDSLTFRYGRLPPEFFARGACAVAQDLLGKLLVSQVGGQLVVGKIVETEAYCDGREPDLACHASKNKGRPTKRTAVMFGPAGHSYVYLNYGLHWLFNVVTDQDNVPGAVLVRAVEPVAGEEVIAQRRPRVKPANWCNGPAKLTKALGIDQSQNGKNLCAPESVIWIEDAPPLSTQEVKTGPRVGLGKKTAEPWFSIPWRYWIAGNSHVSKG